MYAVIETGGRQYKIAVGDKLKVGKLAAAEGASLEFAPASFGRVLMVADGEQITVGPPAAETPVSVTVLGHGLDDRIRVFKRKRRKDYRRTQGHRQSYTEIEITAIGGAGLAKTKATAKPVAKPAAKPATQAETAEKPPRNAADQVVKKTTAKKAAVKKKPAASKAK